MNKLLFIFLLFPFQILSQNDNEILIQPLTFVDTIYETKSIKNLQELKVYEGDNHFFISSYKENEGLFFIKQKYDNWLIYELDFNRGPNTIISSVQKLRRDYIDIQAYRSPSGKCQNAYGFKYLLNPEKCTVITYSNYNRQECYDSTGRSSGVKNCRVELEIINGVLFFQSNKEKDDGMYCFETSEYVLNGDKYVRIN